MSQTSEAPREDAIERNVSSLKVHEHKPLDLLASAMSSADNCEESGVRASEQGHAERTLATLAVEHEVGVMTSV
jgi:hypothetical protein